MLKSAAVRSSAMPGATFLSSKLSPRSSFTCLVKPGLRLHRFSSSSSCLLGGGISRGKVTFPYEGSRVSFRCFASAAAAASSSDRIQVQNPIVEMDGE